MAPSFVHAIAIGFIVVTVACSAPPLRAPTVATPDVRVAAILRTWGDALERNDEAALARTEDREGLVAVAYAGVKVLASEVPDGASAVETTLGGNLLIWALQATWPGLFGPPAKAFVVVLPTGSLGPGLVAAGLAAPVEGTPYTVAAVPAEATLERIREAAARHRAKLRTQAAWTCRAVRIERTILPSEPSLAHMASVSTTIFAGWLAELDAIWLVRAACASGPGLFVVTGRTTRGAVADRVAIAWLP